MQPEYQSIDQMSIFNFAIFIVGGVSTILEHHVEKYRHQRLDVVEKSPLFVVLHPSYNTSIRNFIGTVVLPFAFILNSLFNPSPFPILQRVIWNG